VIDKINVYVDRGLANPETKSQIALDISGVNAPCCRARVMTTPKELVQDSPCTPHPMSNVTMNSIMKDWFMTRKELTESYYDLITRNYYRHTDPDGVEILTSERPKNDTLISERTIPETFTGEHPKIEVTSIRSYEGTIGEAKERHLLTMARLANAEGLVRLAEDTDDE
jgi:hypothetical protein